MKKYYDRENRRLVFVSREASPVFWDKHWSTADLKQTILRGAANKFYTGITRRFLKASRSIKILDGGCGRGDVVYSLQKIGYDAYGVDFAGQTIQSINQTMSQLKVSRGDVTRLNFPDNYFDGYWSLGVIEHSFTGYQSIIQEAYRVIRPNGYLFITYPYLSPLRKIKAYFGRYPAFENQTSPPNNFYQFALNKNTVTEDLARLGFVLKYQRPVDGLKGLKSEIALLKPWLNKLGHYPRAALTELAAPFSGHVMLQVLQKQ